MLDPTEPEPYEVSARKLRAVGGGLRLVYVGIMLNALTVLGLFAGMIALAGGAAQGNAAPAFPAMRNLEWVVMAAWLMSLFASLLQVYGRWRCRDLPRGLNAEASLRTTLAVDFWNVGLMAWTLVAALAAQAGLGNNGGPPRWLAEKILYASMAAPVFFLLFLRETARYIDRADLAQRARSVLVWGSLCVAGLAGIVGCSLFARPGAAPGQPPNFNNAPGGDALLAAIGIASIFLMVALPITALRYVLLLKQLPPATLDYADRLDAAALAPPEPTF